MIKGGSYDKIKKALNQWLNLYSDDLDNDFSFELYNNGNEEYILNVASCLDNEKFNYLVNYLYYPNGIQYKVNIEGFTTATDSKLFPKEHLNKRLLIYIPETDNEGDNVYAVTSNNDHLKIDFGGHVKEVNSRKYYKSPDFYLDKLLNPEIITINKKEIFKNKNLASEEDVKRRFKIVSIIVLIIFLFSFLLFQNAFAFIEMTTLISFGVMFWFFRDYKMLQIDRYYYFSLFISLIILIYGLILQTKMNPTRGRDLIDMSTKLPMIFLILQSPTRYLFKKIIKREPVVKRPTKTFEDAVYIIVLITVTLLIAFLVSSMKID